MPGILRLRVLSVSDHGTFADPEEGWLIEVPDDLSLEAFDELLGALIGWSPATDARTRSRYRWFLYEAPLLASATLAEAYKPGTYLLTLDRAPSGAAELYDVWLDRRLTPDPQTLYPRELDAHHPNPPLERQPGWDTATVAPGDQSGEQPVDEEAIDAEAVAPIVGELHPELASDTHDEAAQVARDLRGSLREVLRSQDPLSPASTLRVAKVFREDDARLTAMIDEAHDEGLHGMLIHLLQIMAHAELLDDLERALQASTAIPMDTRFGDLMLTVMPELARLDPDTFLDVAETITEVDRVDLFALTLMRAGVTTPRAAQLYRRAIIGTPLPTMVAQLAFDAAEAGASLVIPALEERLDALPDMAALTRIPFEGHVITAWAIQKLGGRLTPERIARLQGLGPSARNHPYWSKISLDASAGTYRAADRPDRNDPCWCGSGKKYKKCHMRQDEA